MRSVKWLSLIVFLFSVCVSGFYYNKEVKTRDTEGPIIEMDKNQIYVSIHDGEEALFKGVTAFDQKDGDVTDSLVIESMSEFVEGEKRYINYAAFDSDNHVTKLSRRLVYVDYEPIRFSLEEPLRFPAASSATMDVLGRVHAQDCLDGDLSDSINFSSDSSVSMYDAGDYKVTLEVSNSAGDIAKLPVTITIYNSLEENNNPKIQLSKYLVYTKKGEKPDLKSYLETVTYRGLTYRMTDGEGLYGIDTTQMSREEVLIYQEQLEADPTISYEEVTIVDRIDYQTPGVYEAAYTITTEDGKTGNVNMVVIVEKE